MCSIIVFWFIGINGFGKIFVNGWSLVPLPPAIITTGTLTLLFDCEIGFSAYRSDQKITRWSWPSWSSTGINSVRFISIICRMVSSLSEVVAVRTLFRRQFRIFSSRDFPSISDLWRSPMLMRLWYWSFLVTIRSLIDRLSIRRRVSITVEVQSIEISSTVRCEMSVEGWFSTRKPFCHSR